jgi:hypothetical protein
MHPLRGCGIGICEAKKHKKIGDYRDYRVLDSTISFTFDRQVNSWEYHNYRSAIPTLWEPKYSLKRWHIEMDMYIYI